MIADFFAWAVPLGYYYAPPNGIVQLPKERIASSLSADGGLGSMPRQDKCLIRQNQKLVAYAGNQQIVVTAGTIGTADARIEQRVPAEHDAISQKANAT